MQILFITSNRIGDAILSTGLISHLAKQYPNARFTIAAGKVSAPLFGGVPGLKRIILMPKKKFGYHWFHLWRKTIFHKWDMVIDLRRSAICYLLFTRKRYIQFKGVAGQHRVQLLASTLGLEATPPAPQIWTNTPQDAMASKLIPNSNGPILAIGPTANWAGKIWPAENFAALIEKLTSMDGLFPNAQVAVFGAPDERLQASPVLRAIPKDRRIDLVGKIDLLTAAACMKRCSLYIGNDSGLMHMAAASNIPTLGLFGPSKTEHYAPWGEHARWVRTPESFDELMAIEGYDHRTTGTMMGNLTVDDVASAAHKLWNNVTKAELL